jgi:hypothetical protein
LRLLIGKPFFSIFSKIKSSNLPFSTVFKAFWLTWTPLTITKVQFASF